MNHTTLKEIDDLYSSKAALTEQAEAFDELLTAISDIITQIKNNMGYSSLPVIVGKAESYETTTYTAVVQHTNWSWLLDSLTGEILPELYAIYHSNGHNIDCRRYLHQYMLSLWQQSQSWFDNVLALNKNLDRPIKNKDFRSDNYTTSRGENAEIAQTLLSIMPKFDIDMTNYIKQLDAGLAVYLNSSKLKGVLPMPTDDLIAYYEHWQAQRLSSFSKSVQPQTQPSIQSATQLPTQASTVLIASQHPLTDYLLADMNLDAYKTQRHNRKLVLSVQERTQLIYSIQQGLRTSLIFLALIALVTVPVFTAVFTVVASFISSHILFKYLKSNYFARERVEPYLLSSFRFIADNLVVAFIALFAVSFMVNSFTTMIMTFLLITLVVTGVQYCYGQPIFQILHKLINKQPLTIESTASQVNTDRLKVARATSSHTPDHSLKQTSEPFSKQSSKQFSKQSSTTHVENTHATLLPVDIDRHTHHLQLILSDSAEAILKNLVVIVNETYKSLDYLQAEHAYLATSVKELLLDIASNSLLRLDNVAKKFVIDDEVNPSTKQVFAKQYEKQVTELFHHHIEELTALNQSIIEKQMAGFSQTGTEEELQFRDRVMELKILLRWHIAQSPNNETASSHHVILKSLEDTTLKQMTDAFYATTSTAAQRQTLQSQIDALLEHFKSRSTMNETSSTDARLQLTHNKGMSIDEMDLSFIKNKDKAYRDNISEFDSLDASNSKTETQAFIDFNDHYINQIKKHW